MQATSVQPVLKTRVFTLIVILTNVLGDSLLRMGMRQVGPIVSASPTAYLMAFLNPWVAVGVTLLVLWMLSHMALLSWADLSYVLPVTSIGYALVAVAGYFFLDEVISATRCAGIALIVAGVILVGRTELNTTHHAA